MTNVFDRKIIHRIVADTFLFLAVLFSPWWIVLFVAVAFVFAFNNFKEVFVVGIALDSLYGTRLVNVYGFYLFFSLFFLLLWFFGEVIKKKMRFYSS